MKRFKQGKREKKMLLSSSNMGVKRRIVKEKKGWNI